MHPTHRDMTAFLRQARPKRLRSLRAFAEAEVVIPDGPFAGRKFRCDRQPYTRLWFDAVDAGHWNRCVATGPTQSGKTLACFIIPLCYHLFELEETVICGLPDMDMAGDKWREDILPVIEQSSFRSQLPRQGGGSRGGRVESIQFRNGATLKFMSGGGGDKSRAGFTSRVLVITETDGLDQPGTTSRESDKLTQLEARTRAYGRRKRVYLECTVSTEQGRTWQEYQQGTRSRIVVPCPRCQVWVSPEREHLVGWQGAPHEVAARDSAHFQCPDCQALWTADDRHEANLHAKLLHGDQTIDEHGVIHGDPPATETLGFRWSAVNNLFLTPGDFGADEWRAARSPDEDHAERELRQFVWCLPVAPNKFSETHVDCTALMARMVPLARGIIPATATCVTAAIDLGKYLTHWIAVAWSPGARGHIVDYGRIEVASEDLGVEPALLATLRDFRDRLLAGWPIGTPGGKTLQPQQVWIDAGYMTDVVYTFCRQTKSSLFRPAVGRGAAQQQRQWYNRPTQTGSVVKHIGEGFHINWLPAEELYLVEIDADQWKTWVHARLTTPLGTTGAMSLYQGGVHEHLALAKHLTAEQKVEEFVAGKGVVVKWERLRRQNHWFDALYNACAAAAFCGVRLVESPDPPPSPRKTAVHGFDRPDGRPWIDVEEWHERLGRYF